MKKAVMYVRGEIQDRLPPEGTSRPILQHWNRNKFTTFRPVGNDLHIMRIDPVESWDEVPSAFRNAFAGTEASLEIQEEACRKYAEGKGFEVTDTVRLHTTEGAPSELILDRLDSIDDWEATALDGILDMVACREVDGIVIYSRDRVASDPEVWREVVEWFEAHGVELLSVEGGDR